MAGPQSVSLNPKEAGIDYALQGEYQGALCELGCVYNYGLQVIALGDGKFKARLYRGGLPGNGYHMRGATWTLEGSRDPSGRLSLSGEEWTIRHELGRAVTVYSVAHAVHGYLHPWYRYSPTVGQPPPPGARVLFSGMSTEALKNVRVSEDGDLQVGAETVHSYQNFLLHVEFKTPFMPQARGQARGNSGVYLQKRYEVQILDSFGELPQNNEAGSMYKFKAPDINMSFPPLRWQTYDICFYAAKYEAGQKVQPARISVWHNGILIHNQITIENKTGGGLPEGPDPKPILFQNHGDPVEFRNIWIVELPDIP